MRVSPACAPGSLAIVERVRSSVSWKSSAVYDGAGLAPAELGGLFAPMIPRTTIPVVTRDVRVARVDRTRSEEHTSELQSRGQLVCRLLLAKNNINCAATD